MAEPSPAFRSAFVAITGQTNVGKSTLLNRILGTTVSVVTRRPQTTRNRILGVHHFAGGQLVLVDTPGLHVPQGELGRRMVALAERETAGADAILLVADAARAPGDWERGVLARIGRRPALLALNKVDLVDKPRLLPRIAEYASMAELRSIHPISALDGAGVGPLVEALESVAVEGPEFFPPDMVTDVSEQFLAAELIRAEVAVRTGEELPYRVAVVVDQMEEVRGRLRIEARIVAEREGQKRMLIGSGAHKVREIGAAARRQIGRRLGVEVDLFLSVRVKKGWTRDPCALDRLGYGREEG